MYKSFVAVNDTLSNKILLIDDEETCAISMNMLLKDSDYELIIAKDGQEALAILDNKKINLILLDLMLPDIYGIELLKKIKSISYLKSIPIILQTGSSNWEEIRRAKLCGAEGLIRKPYQKDTLIRTIDKFSLVNSI